MIKTDVLVIGGGVIGLSVALRMLDLGREVILVDPAEPGSGASYGNAGTIADYAVLPVGSPSVLKNLPALLFNKNSPIAIRQSAIASLAPWLMRFLYQSMPRQTALNIQAIADLVADACPRWEVLAKQIKGDSMLHRNGCLYLYVDQPAFKRGLRDIVNRQKFGVTAEMITPSELVKLEPTLAKVKGGAAFFPNAISINDPGKMLELLLNAVIGAGGQVQKTSATKIERDSSDVIVHLDNTSKVKSQHVVIAAGAYSRQLARQAGDKIPLETERGYHLEYDMDTPLLKRPSCSTEQGFYLSPMQGRLRVAGTVELGGLSPSISAHRVEHLKRGALEFFPDLGEPNRTWLGFRPSIPDSRPVISASKKGNDVVYAFGHGHIGLTLAPITAEAVASIIMKTPPPLPLEAYSAQRF